MTKQDQATKIRTGDGFIAALDQSGGSTPKALRLYGIDEDRYATEAEMFDLIHEMRSRIVQSPAFSGDRILAAILFEQTMEREIGGKPSAEYLWQERGVVPFLKIDKGLAGAEDGVRLMKPMPELENMLERAREKGIFGTKMRSVIDAASPTGIASNVEQQFEFGQDHPHPRPGADHRAGSDHLDHRQGQGRGHPARRDRQPARPAGRRAGGDAQAHPARDGEPLQPLIDHPRVMRVVALSGGYSREEANARLARNKGMVASFSRALTEGLSAQQSDAEFDRVLGDSIKSIHSASVAG